jgi:Fe2+ transport system protein FeoA
MGHEHGMQHSHSHSHGHGHGHGHGHRHGYRMRHGHRMVENSLYTVPENRCYTVAHVPDVKILSSLGFYPGTVVHKKKRYGWGGPVLVNLATREIALGKDIASAILVKEAKEQEAK